MLSTLKLDGYLFLKSRLFLSLLAAHFYSSFMGLFFCFTRQRQYKSLLVLHGGVIY